ncbi:MAG: hypothetical protein JWN02_843 [Acidobacteria bacterium]|nr:hypothetical protein [Acidobacteriota bacterium]
MAVLLFSACSSVLPWQKLPEATELNLAFTVRNNLLFLPSAKINGHPGRIFFGSAAAHSVVDPAYAAAIQPAGGDLTLQLATRESLRFSPVVTPLGNVGDALIGADVWGNKAVTIDYRSGLITYQKEGIHPEEMKLFRFEAEPAVTVEVDGQPVTAIVDTASPDTLVLHRPAYGRGTAHVAVAGTDFGTIDVLYTNVAQARIGNRLLSKFLLSIDYGHHLVGLWRDPRIGSKP